MGDRKVYAAKLALVDADRVMTVLSIGPFPKWTDLLRTFLEGDYEEGPTHQWSVLVDADLPSEEDKEKKGDELKKEQKVIWAPIFFKGIQSLLDKGKTKASSVEVI